MYFLARAITLLSAPSSYRSGKETFGYTARDTHLKDPIIVILGVSLPFVVDCPDRESTDVPVRAARHAPKTGPPS